MTQTPVHKLVLTLAIPTIISMLVTNIYSIADTYFVSSLGTSASGATGVVFGLMAIIQAFGFMFGHGVGSNISRKLGDHHIEDARKFASTSFYSSLLFGCLIMILGLSFQIPLARLLGSTDSILPYALNYSHFILIAAPAMTSGCVMNNILRYEGKATFAMIGLTTGGILNIFGDYILIRQFHMGIAGAGIATAFRDDKDVIRIGTQAMRFQCITLICIPISTAGNMLFQSIGKSGRAILLASL